MVTGVFRLSARILYSRQVRERLEHAGVVNESLKDNVDYNAEGRDKR